MMRTLCFFIFLYSSVAVAWTECDQDVLFYDGFEGFDVGALNDNPYFMENTGSPNGWSASAASLNVNTLGTAIIKYADNDVAKQQQWTLTSDNVTSGFSVGDRLCLAARIRPVAAFFVASFSVEAFDASDNSVGTFANVNLFQQDNGQYQTVSASGIVPSSTNYIVVKGSALYFYATSPTFPDTMFIDYVKLTQEPPKVFF